MKTLLSILPLVLLVGCTTAKITEKRISKHQAMFDAQPAEHQALIRQNRIVEGMNQDAVFLAWGRADEVISGTKEGKAIETWFFGGGYDRRRGQHVSFGYGSGYGGGFSYGVGTTFPVGRAYDSGPTAKVVFTSGVVTEWQSAR